ncbi:S-layer homology domain-containing protein [Deinococcus cavernae]|uniref:S-layer homology domain-containing protein n=1 Tax=Deinococcus cavernae TaxID=2320857 RepID=A0A418VAT4_9DEIO|nr:S-layer homology domain-containing protein [Deinococcus cavernae]RJF73241.1 S-layer homology domain-containing protein [Deinococcus cavernae]
MRNTLMISSIVALSLGVAGAQTAPATSTPATTTAAPAQVTLSDVPAGHWAKDAVDKIVSCGLIQGFPDGTFRGNENLTRYQAALIFHRLLTSGAMAQCGFSSGDMTTIVNGMQEVSTELAAISTRVGDLEKANADQAARIAALEEKIAGLNTGAASADVTALTARIDALEAAIKNIPAGPQGPAGPAGPQGPAGPAGTAAAPAPVTSTTTTVVTEPATPAASTTVVIGDVAPAMADKNLYAGLSFGAKMSDIATKACKSGLRGNGADVGYCTTVGGMIGSKSVFGPIGARVAVDYNIGQKAVNADLAATYNLDLGTNLGVYAGLGLGLTASPTYTTTGTAGSTTDMYGLGLVGVEYRFTDSIAAFVEGNGRYYLSNKGTGTGISGNSSSTTRGFNGAVKAGVKFYF